MCNCVGPMEEVEGAAIDKSAEQMINIASGSRINGASVKIVSEDRV
jgi:hypothetical protein